MPVTSYYAPPVAPTVAYYQPAVVPAPMVAAPVVTAPVVAAAFSDGDAWVTELQATVSDGAIYHVSPIRP